MAKKSQTQFVCSSCGAAYGTWSGKCQSCGEWNTLEEQLTSLVIGGSSVKGRPLASQNITRSIASDKKRILSGFADVDAVLGGGFVGGSVNLIAGQPGIGKSTLLLQIADKAAGSTDVLYISGEESAHQVGLRAKRLGVSSTLELANSNSADDIAATIAAGKFSLVIVDSIQTVSCSAISSAAGTVSQITNSTQLITAAAKQSNTAVVLVGHVTKEGSIAGPKVLEHSVDVVLQLEGDAYSGMKLLRAAKNRYGSINEVAIMEMADIGLRAVDNPSATLLAERQPTDGSVVLATMEGSRAILVEVQALVNKTSYGYPKRAASGFDLGRLNLLVAMLERRTKLNLAEYDIYINIVGGLQIREPAADLAVCMAVGSAAKGLQLKQNVVVFGEVGLSGEVRHVPHIDKRLAEAKKLGFTGAIGPKRPVAKLSHLHSVSSVRQAMNEFLQKD